MWASLLMLLAAVAVADASAGETSAAFSPLASHCRADGRKLCKDVRGGWNAVRDCLQAHRNELSRDCSRELAATEGLHRDCREDVQRHCSDIYPVQGRVFECLRANQDELSPRCRAHVTAAWRATDAAQEACRDDLDRFCSDVRPGAGRELGCLKQHEADLSKACTAALGGGKTR